MQEEEFYTLPSYNDNRHRVAPQIPACLATTALPTSFSCEVCVLAFGGVCKLIGSNSPRSRSEGVQLGCCEGCLRHATSRQMLLPAQPLLCSGTSWGLIVLLLLDCFCFSSQALLCIVPLAQRQGYTFGTSQMCGSIDHTQRQHALQRHIWSAIWECCYSKLALLALRSQQTALTLTMHRCKCTDARGL